jgi:hypothetical protein
MKNNRFYVYMFLDPRRSGEYVYGDLTFDYEPFYVGKGSTTRIQTSLCKRANKNNVLKSKKIEDIKRSGNKIIVIKIADNLNEKEALLLEEKYIKTIGKIIDKAGPLSNMRSSGKEQAMADKSKLKISINNAKYWKNKSIKPIHKSITTPTYCVYKAISPDGKEFIIDDGLGKFCKKHNLLRSHMVSVASNKRKHHKNWKCLKIKDNKHYDGCKFLLKNLTTGEEIITNNIKEFSNKNNMRLKRLYEVSRGKHYCHNGWTCTMI